MSRPISCRGTLGDSFICMLKMYEKKDRYIVNHHTIHKYLWHQIAEIYSLIKNVEVRFVKEPRLDLEELTSDVHEQNMEFFPVFNIKQVARTRVLEPYHIIQPHSGKLLRGFNNKTLPISWVEDMILTEHNLGKKIVLVGTDPSYAHIGSCVNLIGKTTLKDTFSLINHATTFTGIEGVLAFYALSQRKSSFIFYASKEAVERRIEDSPWAKYAILTHLSSYNDYIEMKKIWRHCESSSI